MQYIPGLSGPSNPVITIAKKMQEQQEPRIKAYRRWYDLLKMVDALKQEGMESFVGNDPRTTWNMSTYLLQPKPLVVKIVTQDGSVLTGEAMDTARLIEQYLSRVWVDVDQKDLLRGYPSWFWNYIGMMTATGGYALSYLADSRNKLLVDYWNPASIFVDYSSNTDEGCQQLAKIKVESADAAYRTIQREGWYVPGGRLQGNVTEYQVWRLNSHNQVEHGVSIDNNLVKPLTVVSGLVRIPYLVGYVGGLPDDGTLDKDYISNAGQSILAPNEPIYRNYNRQQTYQQQLLRDTANPRIKIKSSSNKLLSAVPTTWYGRGAFYGLGANEDIEVIQTPGVPVELTELIFSMRNMLQRGGFSDITFGNITTRISSLMVSQAAESAMQLLQPFKNAVVMTTTYVTNNWYQAMLDNPIFRPAGVTSISDELHGTKAICDYSIRIPGDLQNRVMLGKQLNPRFEVPVEQIMGLLLPEITNPAEAIARLQGERARNDPVYAAVTLVQAFQEAADRARRTKNQDAADFFDQMASIVKQRLTTAPTPADRMGTATNPAEAAGLPPRATAPQSPLANSRLGMP